MVLLSNWSIYVGLAINGFFTGFGAVLAGLFAELWVRPYLHRLKKKVNG